MPDIENQELINTLFELQRYGIQISIVIDSRSSDKPGARLLINHLLPIHARALNAFNHDFFIIIDETTVFTGSTSPFAENSSVMACIGITSKDLRTEFYREFMVLANGQNPDSKDAEFDTLLGPFGKYHDSAWYLSNQIITDGGVTKGRWPDKKTNLNNSEFRVIFGPYKTTESVYNYYVENMGGTYSINTSTVSYPDYNTGTNITTSRFDAGAYIAEKINSAQKSVTIISSTLSDPLVVYSIIQTANRGVSTDVILDYNYTGNSLSNHKKQFDELSKVSNISLCRFDYNTLLQLNTIIIDNSTVILSCGGFSYNALNNNDNLIIVVESGAEFAILLENIPRQIAVYLQKYDINGIYNDYIPINNMEKM